MSSNFPPALPTAQMGFVGFAQFVGVLGATDLIRTSSCDIMLRQDIEAPDIIDGRYDRTLYRLGPFEAGGGMEFPAIFGTSSDCDYSIAGGLLGMAVNRQGASGLLQSFDTKVRYTGSNYTGDSAFIYKDCIINSYQFSVTQGDQVNISLDIIALYRENNAILPYPPGPTLTPVTRIITWNDAYVNLTLGDGTEVESAWVRSFEANFNNNAERYYTLNGSLYPQAVAPRKRDIEGTLTLLGRNNFLADRAYTNVDRCVANAEIDFGYNVTASGCCGTLNVLLPNVVFQIEEMSQTVDLFETTINWRALPDTQEQLVENWVGVPYVN